MKVNALIKKLQAIKEEHGNIEVLFPTDQIEGMATLLYRENILDNDYWGNEPMECRYINTEGFRSDGSPLSDIELGEVDITWVDDGNEKEKKYISLIGSFFKYMDKEKDESDSVVHGENFKPTFKLKKKA
jgi:hypothetical protein